MSYIFIEKEQHEVKTTKQILLEIIDEVAQNRDETMITIDGVEIEYRIIQKRNSKRCFLELVTKDRVSRGISVLQVVDNSLLKSREQRYYHSIRDYDGISENFCKRLYPKYAMFERKLRSMILFILTKAYGSNWRSKTVSDELLGEIRGRAANGNVSLNETLENMDFAMLEAYLFEKREANYSAILDEKLSTIAMQKMSKEEICAVVEKMRATSLWERHFIKFGTQEEWEGNIKEIHGCRNKVAHQKTISVEEFSGINKKINKINKRLDDVIDGIREENFTEDGAVDILGSFVVLLGNKIKMLVESESFVNVVKGFNYRIQEIVKPLSKIYDSGLVEALGRVATYCVDTVSTASNEAIEVAESYSITSKVLGDLAVGKELEDDLLEAKMLASSLKNKDI